MENKVYCIKNYYTFEEKKESLAFKIFFRPFDKLTEHEILDKKFFEIIFFPFFILLVIYFILMFFIIRRWAFIKENPFKCNNTYEFRDYEGEIRVYEEKYGYDETYYSFMKRRNLKKPSTYFGPLYKNYFADFKTYRKKKLLSIKKS